MTFWRLVTRSLTHHWRMNTAVALGVMAATAVLTGALLVGDSIRGSLHDLAVDRLGRIDSVLLVDRFFDAGLAENLEQAEGFSKHYAGAQPGILLQGSIETYEEGQISPDARSSGITIVGTEDSFWELAERDGQVTRPETLPGEDEVVLNQPLATELGVKVGDRVTLRFNRLSQVSGDNPFGDRSTAERLSRLVGMKVVDIVPAKGLGRFGLNPSQQLPKNAYVPLATLQDALDKPGRVNALLVAGQDADTAPSEAVHRQLPRMLRPSLDDLGLSVEHVKQTYTPEAAAEEKTAFEYFSVTTDRLILSDATVQLLQQAFGKTGGQPVFTYLANDISHPGEQGIPYSTVTAFDWSEATGRLVDLDGNPIQATDKGEIVLSRWAAEDLGVKVGDRIELTFFEPESTHGETRERTEAFALAAIADLVEPAEPFKVLKSRLRRVKGERRRVVVDLREAIYRRQPTLANDTSLTPNVPGVFDAASMNDWDAPFNYDRTRIRSQDNTYWDNYRLTPKAFLSLEQGRKLWSSRFGSATSYRIPAAQGRTVQSVKEAIVKQFAQGEQTLGFDFLAVKRQALAASQGTTSFAGLFIGFSFFIIAAAVMLVALLFRLGIEQRTSEVGLLLAVGLQRRRTAWLLLAEGLLVAALGGVLGAALGVGYAWAMLVGLQTLWVEAVVTPFMTLHVTWLSLILGYVIGVAVSAAAIIWTLRRMRGVSIRGLMAGKSEEGTHLARHGGVPKKLIAAGVLAVIAAILAVVATRLGGEAQAGAFFGAGAAVLVACLLAFSHILRGDAASLRSGGLGRLAARNAGRNPGRSTLTVGLVAAASFLIVAIGAFRLDPSAMGAGGFDLFAESAQPVYVNLNSEKGRRTHGFVGEEAELLEQSTILSLRLKPGDDASCLNVYQPQRPRILGATPQFVQHFSKPEVTGFSWAGTAAETEEEQENPWLLLDEPADDDAIPVVLDKNTAMYSLHLFVVEGIGTTFAIEMEDGRTLKFRIVGLLSNSLLQGSLVISEEHFERLFPRISGYRFFFIAPPEGKRDEVSSALESRLGDQGFDVADSRKRLESLLAVQNTYLSTFQSLGALGLLLGTFGLATVQTRNVFERRGELALLRATGFRRRRLGELVMLENALLLLAGLAVGVIAALVAVLPHMFSGGAAVPLETLSIMLGVVAVVGLLSGFFAVGATLRAPLISALRGD